MSTRLEDISLMLWLEVGSYLGPVCPWLAHCLPNWYCSAISAYLLNTHSHTYDRTQQTIITEWSVVTSHHTDHNKAKTSNIISAKSFHYATHIHLLFPPNQHQSLKATHSISTQTTNMVYEKHTLLRKTQSASPPARWCNIMTKTKQMTTKKPNLISSRLISSWYKKCEKYETWKRHSPTVRTPYFTCRKIETRKI